MAEAVEQAVLQRLVAAGKVTPQLVADWEARTGEPLEGFLVDQRVVTASEYAQVKAEILQLPYVDLENVTIPREVLTIIPESTAREHAIIAYEDTPEALHVAVEDPADRQIVEFVQKKVNKPVAVAIASRTGIQVGLALYQQSLDTELESILRTAPTVVSKNQDLTKVAEDLPVIRTVDLVLKHAISEGASDIHIEPTETSVVIRYRIDGILHDKLTLSRDFMAGIVARLKVMSNLKIDEHRLPQDGRFKIEGQGYNVAFRVSTLPVYDGEKVVMRLLDESGHGLGLSDIGMRQNVLTVFRANIKKPNGMILVTGPTGSGKTTTLYAAMRELNTPDVNISTIEDPIEYRMPRINQTQVNPQIGLTFGSGLRSLVRQDPDILMVGEIRDAETASLAVNASLTGHLVLSTLHTNSAAGALPRLLDMGVEAFLVASTVNLIVAQRLVRRLCPDCRTETLLDSEALADIKKVINLEMVVPTLQEEKIVEGDVVWEKMKVYAPGSCKSCSDGYRGRIGIYEALDVTDAIREMITPKTTSQTLEEAARKQNNMLTMLEDGFVKVLQGMTSLEEVLRVATE